MQRSLEWSKTFLSHAEKNKEELEKENKKLENVKGQLRIILVQYGVLQEDIGVDENISYLEWEKKPEIKKKIEEITKKERREKSALEGEISSLRKQLEDNGISPDKHHVRDKRLRKEAISEVEAHWRINQDKNEKINRKTITKVLGKNWKNDFSNKEKEEITQWKDQLIKRIYEEVKLTKQ